MASDPVICDECGKRPAKCVGHYDGSCTAIHSCAKCCDHDGLCRDLEPGESDGEEFGEERGRS